ncbi:MAG TPA: hypothetical protein VK536_05480 [Candidatus Limnocylindrales bacterium]|nr:hypothetical protein [Candidatus Limnocylindrales bacterium]
MAIAKASKLSIIVLTIAAIALTSLTIAAVTVNVTVSSSGTIIAGPNVGVYSNSACTNAITSINWGSIEAGSSTSETIYIEDTGGAAMTPSIAVSGWSPSTASSYITLTWSSLPSSISPGASNAVEVTLTLSVPTSINGQGITSFSNTITISGTG